MSRAAVREASDGVLELSGVLDYLSGPDLRKKGGALIKASKSAALVVDCSAVTKSSSVGVSLLLAFMRDAQAVGKPFTVRELPHDMQKIAGVSGLLEILPQPA